VSTLHNVCIVLGTRPEAIKLAPVIQAFQAAPDFRTRVVLTGQHREMVAQVMELFGLEADHDLALMAPKQTLTHITCGALQGLQAEFEQHKPDLVLVQGDTTTAFASALAAFYAHGSLSRGGESASDLPAGAAAFRTHGGVSS
jgi:UDP-N-acetylglucosamine 2-epimerase (non-hydrolysing)